MFGATFLMVVTTMLVVYGLRRALSQDRVENMARRFHEVVRHELWDHTFSTNAWPEEGPEDGLNGGSGRR